MIRLPLPALRKLCLVPESGPRERYWNDEDLVIRKPVSAITGRVEIARSFSFKLNVGDYQSRDFFCSEKAECAIEDADAVAAALEQFCKRQVLKAVNQYKDENRALTPEEIRTKTREFSADYHQKRGA